MRLPKKRSYLKNSLIVLHILFAVIGFYTFIFNYQLSEKILVQRTLTKQSILAKAGSTSVENLLKNVQNQLSSFVFSFAKVKETGPIDEDATRTEFSAYMGRSLLPINGIALYNEAGKLIIIDNRVHTRVGEGQDFSKTAFIQWSKNPVNKDKTFISTPYIGTAGASIGKIIIILAKPVYFGDTYKGTLSIRILVNDFRDAFITPLISDSDEDSLIVNNKGVVLAGNSFLINQNLFSYAQKQPWNQDNNFTNKLTIALKSNATQTSWTFQNPHEKPKELLVGVSKIDIPDTDKDLYLIVGTSKESIIASLQALRVYGFAWLGFGVITTTLGGIIVMLIKTS